MKKKQMWTGRSLSNENKDDMNIGSILWFVEGK